MLVSNCTLLRILDGAGDLDDYQLTAPTAQLREATKWSGSEDAYLEEKTLRVAGPAGSEYQKQWRIYLQAGRPAIKIEPEDRLQITRREPDGSTPIYTVPVISIDVRIQPDMPPDIQTLAILVEPSG